MGSCFCWRRYVGRYVGMYVCEQLPGANSSPIDTKLQSYPWPQETRWLNLRRSRSKVKVGGEVCALLNALLVVVLYQIAEKRGSWTATRQQSSSSRVVPFFYLPVIKLTARVSSHRYVHTKTDHGSAALREAGRWLMATFTINILFWNRKRRWSRTAREARLCFVQLYISTNIISACGTYISSIVIL